MDVIYIDLLLYIYILSYRLLFIYICSFDILFLIGMYVFSESSLSLFMGINVILKAGVGYVVLFYK